MISALESSTFKERRGLWMSSLCVGFGVNAHISAIDPHKVNRERELGLDRRETG